MELSWNKLNTLHANTPKQAFAVVKVSIILTGLDSQFFSVQSHCDNVK